MYSYVSGLIHRLAWRRNPKFLFDQCVCVFSEQKRTRISRHANDSDHGTVKAGADGTVTP